MAKNGSRTQPDQPKFHLKRSESVAEGFSRAICEQLTTASRHLSSGSEQTNEAVHEARKALKKSRALLRLIRPALGGTYRVVNTELRDLGRTLSELRDTQALADSVSGLNHAISDELSNGILEAARKRLLRRREEIVRGFTKRGETGRIARALDRIRSRAVAWPIDQATTATVSSAVAETVRRGRKAFERARRSGRPEDFHEWRKRAKDLRYQMDFLDRLWPHVFEGYSESAQDLEQRLGEDHNLSVLRPMLTATDGAKKQDLDRVLSHLDKEQSRLRRKAERIGHLLYAERPKKWRKRIERCWASRR